MSKVASCVRAGCFHSTDDHKMSTGRCTIVSCACASFLASRETLPKSPEANESPPAHATTQATPPRAPKRETMPSERPAYTKVFRLPHQLEDGSTGVMRLYFTVGLYDDGRPGEVFVKADKAGTIASGALDAVAIFMSMCLQAGVPLKDVVDKIKGMRFPPYGFTGDPEVKSCTSPLDLLARWLEFKFLPKETP